MFLDRYQFPDKDDKGKVVRHGFQIGKLTDEKAKSINEKLESLGEYKRDVSKTVEKFEVVKTEKSGEYTFYVPQKLLADSGVDLNLWAYSS